MSKGLDYRGKRFRPLLNPDNTLNVRAAVAYGPAGTGTFMLTVYVMCVPFGAGTKGGKAEDQRMDVRAYRESIPNTASHEAQYQQLTFMLNIVATRLERDYTLRLPLETKPTPKYVRRT